MNAITQILLGGAALGALATAPAMAGDVPHLSVTALHAGNVVHKTKVHGLRCNYRTCYTETIYTNVPASDLGTRVNLGLTYYKLNSNDSLCSTPKQKIKVAPKRTAYAAIGTATETYSFGCPSGPTVFYGDTYKLKTASGEGETDSFQSLLKGTIQDRGVKYKERLLLDVIVAIGE